MDELRMEYRKKCNDIRDNVQDRAEREKQLTAAKNAFEYKKRADKDKRAKEEIVKALPPVEVGDQDLIGYSETEKSIIRTYLQNTEMPAGKIASETGESIQFVTSVIHSDAVKKLRNKLILENLSAAWHKTLANGIATGDPTCMRLAADLEIVKTTTDDIKKNQLTSFSDLEARCPWIVKVISVMGDFNLMLDNVGERYSLLLVADPKAPVKKVQIDRGWELKP